MKRVRLGYQGAYPKTVSGILNIVRMRATALRGG
jgi:hypothetical protein